MLEFRNSGAEIRQALGDLRAEMERRFEAIDRRFDGVDRRFGSIERQFAWLVGLLVTGFVAVIGTVASAFWGVLQVVR